VENTLKHSTQETPPIRGHPTDKAGAGSNSKGGRQEFFEGRGVICLKSKKGKGDLGVLKGLSRGVDI